MTISPDDPRHPARETERQNRGAPDCPVCDRTIALTPRSEVFYRHNNLDGEYCTASGLTEAAALVRAATNSRWSRVTAPIGPEGARVPVEILDEKPEHFGPEWVIARDLATSEELAVLGSELQIEFGGVQR